MIKGAKERLQRNQISKYFVGQKSVFGYIMIKQNSRKQKIVDAQEDNYIYKTLFWCY